MIMKKWILKSIDESPDLKGIHPDISRLLAARGITEQEKAEEYLAANPVTTYDPFLMKGMREAVEKIKQHINRGSRICIYGDYDVDGVTAICLLFEFLQNLTDNLEWYIPVRQEEGYGINMNAIRTIRERGTDLLISVDCGISSYKEIELANELGMDTIVTDHHTPGEDIPKGIVLNPKQEGCDYPFKELCGCGVAYKLIQAIQRTLGLPKKTIKSCLDIVAVATVADIVPLVDENRTLVKYGLKELNAKKRPGLASLIDAIGGTQDGKQITATDIAFKLGPHINAGGRVDTAESSLRLLIEKDRNKAEELADRMVSNNELRKSLQTEGIKLAQRHLSDDDDRILIMVAGEEIHEGVAGIVAGKLKEEYHRPVLILTENTETGLMKGTGRSIDSVNLYDLLKTQETLLEGFGGHKAACGFSIKKENVEDFRSGLEAVLCDMRMDDPELLTEYLEIDGILNLKDVDDDFGWMLERFEPFGQSNQRPVFMFKDVYLDSLKFVGKDRDHCRFFLKDMKGSYLECIMFNCRDRLSSEDYYGRTYDFVGRIDMNYRGGAYNVQFKPIDFRRSSFR